MSLKFDIVVSVLSKYGQEEPSLNEVLRTCYNKREHAQWRNIGNVSIGILERLICRIWTYVG